MTKIIISILEYKKIFKKLILLDVLVGFLILISYFFQSEKVLNLNSTIEDNNPIIFDWVLLILLIIIVISYFISLILLYRFNKYGKKLYLVTFVVGIIISLFTGPSFYESYLDVLGGLSSSISGGILVFLYYTPLSREFNKKK